MTKQRDPAEGDPIVRGIFGCFVGALLGLATSLCLFGGGHLGWCVLVGVAFTGFVAVLFGVRSLRFLLHLFT